MTRRFFRTWPLFIGLCCASLCGAQPSIRYLDEIGHLASDVDTGKVVTIGPARLVSTGAGKIGLQGRGSNGRTWRAYLPIDGGLGYTTAWEADFDRNGKRDLLIASEFPKNGRCIDPVTLSFLMFDNQGMPVPWVTQTQRPGKNALLALPAVLTEIERDGRLQLVTTDCEYSAPPVVGEDRSIKGVYEANDTMWRLVRSSHIDAYRSLVLRKYRIDSAFTRLLPTVPDNWLDQGNTFDATGPLQTITSVLAASPNCRGVRLPPVVDGRILPRTQWKDPCDEVGSNRIQLSNGTTCYGWPTVMLDRNNVRDIVGASELSELEPLLKEIAAKRYPVVLAGQKELGKCSPSLLWARAPE
ncbi:MAG TPA: hypothetical protein VFW44_02715 [Bryobacteraceae bacterium]|nr:hypothetical protein [Bryobacteraceae bacterium]